MYDPELILKEKVTHTCINGIAGTSQKLCKLQFNSSQFKTRMLKPIILGMQSSTMFAKLKI